MTNASHFAKGSAVYTCRICKRLTRQTGDNGPVRLCADCYILAGEENSLSDSGKFYSRESEIIGTIKALKAKTNTTVWDHLLVAAGSRT